MLVKFDPQERRRNRKSDLYLVLITVVPWIALLWLIWPRR